MTVGAGTLNHQTGRLVAVEPGGLICGPRVAVNPRALAAAQAGVLTAYPGEWRAKQEPVRVCPVREVPEGVLALGRDLLEALELDLANPGWELQVRGVQHLEASGLGLQVAGDQPLEEVVAALSECDDLAGRLLWCPTPGVPQEALVIGGQAYQVWKLAPAPAAPNTVVEVTPKTAVSVRAPGATSGVDIVILADCSGSMQIDDMAAPGAPPESPGMWARLTGRSAAPRVRRDEALREALKRLLRLRTETSGRVSRVALVGFTTECTPLFPKDGGMQEIDETSDQAVIDEFGRAIEKVWADPKGGTRIEEALHYAGQLLREHDRGNEKLIVLISDGAHWVPKGDKATGELIAGDADPVSLMASQYRGSRIRLHAIGISTEKLFDDWCTAKGRSYSPEQRKALCPNHSLLQRLVEVTEGDPATVGDTDELQKYFSGLGGGMERRLRPLRAAPAVELQPFEREALALALPRPAAAGVSEAVRQRRGLLAEELRKLYVECNRLTALAGGPTLFAPDFMASEHFSAAIDLDVQSEKEFLNLFCQEMVKGTLENAKDATRWVGKPNRGKDGPYPDKPEDSEYPELVRLFRADAVRELYNLRHHAAHNKDPKEMKALFEGVIHCLTAKPSTAAAAAAPELIAVKW